VVGASIAGISTAGITDADTLARLPSLAVRGWFAVVEEAAIGFAIATLARSQLAGIGAGLAFYFGELFATVFIPDIVKYMPFAVANASIDIAGSGGGGFGGGGPPARRRSQPTRRSSSSPPGCSARSPWPCLFTERAEITG
jgi:hypothetical protein